MGPTKNSPIKVTSARLLSPRRCGFTDCELSSMTPTSEVAAVYVTTVVSAGLIRAAERGSVVVLLENTTTGFFKTSMTWFKQAWWLGNSQDCNAGTLVYDNAAPILGGMAPEKYAAQTWWRLVNGAQTFLIDDMAALPGSWSAAQKGIYGEQDRCEPLRGQDLQFPKATFWDDKPERPQKQMTTAPANESWNGPVKGLYGDKDCPNSGCHGGSTAPLTVKQCEALCDAQTGCNAFNFQATNKNGSGGCCLRNCPAVKQNGPPHNGECCAYYRGGVGGCPAGFPFPSAHIPKLCYKTKAQASAGEGPCGSWCTQDIKVGSGCGDNSDHLCDASTASVCLAISTYQLARRCAMPIPDATRLTTIAP